MTLTSKKIVFLGTSDFAVPCLEALARDSRFEVAAVITQPDQPTGRHAVLTPPPVKLTAQKLGLPVLQPEKLKELDGGQKIGDTRQETLDAPVSHPSSLFHLPFSTFHLPPSDCFVVASYGKILPQWFLDIPKQGCVNVHASLLPRWRGASPIQAAIAAGDKTTGITIMQMDALLDHGAIIAQKDEPISETDTGGSLHDRLAAHGAEILPDILADYLASKIAPREQEHDLATTCKTLSRDDGKLDFAGKTSEELECLVRAYDPWPGTWMELPATDGRPLRLKILAARLGPSQTSFPPSISSPQSNSMSSPRRRGSDLVFIHDGRPFIICSGGTSLELVTVQPESKRPMTGAEFARGFHLSQT